MAAHTTTDAIWMHLSSDLRQFIFRRVRDNHVADDLLQETFVRVHRSIETLQDKERVAAWVYQIARNVVRDHYRKASTAGVTLADVEDILDDEQGGLPIGSRDPSWLSEMIASLPESYRTAMQLAEIEGLSQQELADRLGLSLSGAKSRVQRGRAMLKSLLEACCTFELDSRGRLSCEPKPHQTTCRDCEN